MDTDRLIICRAAAGSGKTYTLVRQYLVLAFSATEEHLPERFTRILAITFTKKAANEMKVRILEWLDRIALDGTECSMGREIAEELHRDDATLRRQADIVRKAILHNYSDLAVCTIDSFMSRIVKTFAHDLGLPLNYETYIDNTDLIQNAVDDLMTLAGSEGQEELTRALCEFAESKMNEGKSYAIERELAELAEELFKEQTPQYIEALSEIGTAEFLDIQHQMIADNRKYEERLRNLGKEALKAIGDAGLAVEDFYQGGKGAGGFFRKLADGILATPNSYVTDYIEGDKLGSGKASPATRAALAAVKPQLQEYYRQARELMEGEGMLYNTRQLLLKNIYSLAFINKLGELVAAYSRENEIVHLSEVNKRIAEVVQHEPAPFIYERLGNRYWNYMIDEFQDTSRMQWQNLVPLVENGVSLGHTSLVVGDGKQAIYRFRQGDVGQFVALPQVDNPTHGRLLEQPGIGQIARLERNFRTARAIVEFNNGFFTWAIANRFADNADLQDIYIGGDTEQPDLAQQPVKEGGYVQVGFWNLDGDRSTLWQEMLDDIRRLTAGEGWHHKDITVLARDHSTLAEISTYLTARGVPVISSESFLLTQSQAVMLLESLLQYLLDGSNRIAAARVMIYLHSLGRISDTHTEAFLDRQEGIDLDSILDTEGLPLRCGRLRTLGLYDCCEEAVRMLGLDGLEPSYTATFLNIVAKYSANHRRDLGEFLEWFDENKEKLSTSTADNIDAVRLMTIHKAKGLEAPVILYPILNKQNRPNSIWVSIAPEHGIPLPASLVTPSKKEHTIFDAEYADEMAKSDMDRINVLYVALTRPKERLHIYCQQPPKESGTGYTSLLYDYMATREDAVEVRPGVQCLQAVPAAAAKEPDKEGPAAAPATLETLTFPDWTDRIAIAEQSAAVFGKFDETSIRRGNEMHELLALLDNRDGAAEALRRYLQRNKLEESEAELLEKTLARLLEQEDAAPFFDPRYTSKNECSLVYRGEVLRPDRLVYTPEEIWVVDFKTGRPNIQHQEQVGHYCDALCEMSDGRPVRGFLLYLGAERCQVVECR